MSPGDTKRRLLVVLSAAVFIETTFYAVTSPLLPALTHQLHLSKFSAGVLTGSYAAGTLLGALPGGALAVRRGPRFTLLSGLLMLVVSTVGFGLLRSAWALDASRFLEGFGGSCSWAGAIAWIVAASSAQQRGQVLGRTIAWATAGSLLGPVIGALASATGRAVLFCALAGLCVLMVAAVAAIDDHTESSEQGVVEALGVLRRRDMLVAMWLMVIPALVSGVLEVLAPLQLHRFGAGAGVIGLIFLIAAGIETVIATPVGRISDRHGRLLPLRTGLIGTAVTMALFTVPGSALTLGLLVILTFVVLGIFWAPAMALLADVSERYGVDQAHGAGLMNLAWAIGQIVGATAGGGAADALGDGIPVLLTAGICVVTFLAVSGSAGSGRHPLPVDGERPLPADG